MNNTQKKSTTTRGFAAIDAEKRREIAKKGGIASRRSNKEITLEGEKRRYPLRGFAAMDEETRKKIASRGGRSSRRNRIDWKERDSLL
ncbi:MAG TPA: KGG domain-containing protein [Cytophagaceae bacterium]|nr:KGG domain-containing protein [Cytophagaceae bacterium]